MEKKKKRGLLFLMSIVLGGFLGMLVGMFKALAEIKRANKIATFVILKAMLPNSRFRYICT